MKLSKYVKLVKGGGYCICDYGNLRAVHPFMAADQGESGANQRGENEA